jgi:hypothetical protein
MNITTLLHGLSATALLLGLTACAAPGPFTDPPKEDVTITVRVVANGNCGLRLPADKNACKGVHSGDGLACGRPGDIVQWVPGNTSSGVRSVRFPAGNDVVCHRGVTDIDPAKPLAGKQCILADPGNLTETQGVAFKYLIGVNFKSLFNSRECGEQDPYVIVTRR